MAPVSVRIKRPPPLGTPQNLSVPPINSARRLGHIWDLSESQIGPIWYLSELLESQICPIWVFAESRISNRAYLRFGTEIPNLKSQIGPIWDSTESQNNRAYLRFDGISNRAYLRFGRESQIPNIGSIWDTARNEGSMQLPLAIIYNNKNNFRDFA